MTTAIVIEHQDATDTNDNLVSLPRPLARAGIRNAAASYFSTHAPIEPQIAATLAP